MIDTPDLLCEDQIWYEFYELEAWYIYFFQFVLLMLHTIVNHSVGDLNKVINLETPPF